MALWTDLITPAELTGYVRAALADIEANRQSLARWLPNREVPRITVRFVKGRNGLVIEAQFRAFDAEPAIAGSTSGQRVILELPPLGQKRVISEYDQLMDESASDETIRASILDEAKNVARAIADRIERLRGTVLETGKATVVQDNFSFDDDFGRDPSHTVVAPVLWSDPTADRLGQFAGWSEVYAASNDGQTPGSAVMSRKAFTALSSGDQFKTTLIGGAQRPAIEAEVKAYLQAAGWPEIYIYDRRTSAGRVITDTKVLLLPEAVDPNTGTSQLGNTFWGRTLTSKDSNYDLADSEQPGVVVGAHKSETIPHIATVESDAIALPVLANANLSFVARVL
ncbi:Phage major capsid protein E [Arthrobacter sp. yr096]|uniref:major capsid protein n=1 Tax=Arthrobacter sp. yr096 TaxID=1761750 RepID=UPI0008B78D45|nr:major capsid protein [Arthrobacter sp. yr096]SEI44825.1 Phage major capsid protein E [Arthrobacter sp. yr096]